MRRINWTYIQRLCRVAFLVAWVLGQGACASERVVFGNVPPSTFQFKTVIDDRSPAGGGWHVAQVIILLGRLGAMFPRAATCDVEIGVPLVNFQGPVSVEMAQEASAVAADPRGTRDTGAARATDRVYWPTLSRYYAVHTWRPECRPNPGCPSP